MTLLSKKLFLTLFFVVIYILGSYLPNPLIISHIDNYSINYPANDFISLFFGTSIFSLGIMPLVSAYIILKLLQFIFPFFRNSLGPCEKDSGFSRPVYISAGFIACINAIGSYAIVKNQILNSAISYTSSLSTLEMILSIFIWISGFFISLLIAQLINRFGFGNGFLIIYSIAFMRFLPRNLIDYYHTTKEFREDFIIVLIIFLVSMLLLTFIQQSKIPFRAINQNQQKEHFSLQGLRLSNFHELILITSVFTIATELTYFPEKINSLLSLNALSFLDNPNYSLIYDNIMDFLYLIISIFFLYLYFRLRLFVYLPVNKELESKRLYILETNNKNNLFYFSDALFKSGLTHIYIAVLVLIVIIIPYLTTRFILRNDSSIVYLVASSNILIYYALAQNLIESYRNKKND